MAKNNSENIRIIYSNSNLEFRENLNQIETDQKIRVVILGFTDELTFIEKTGFDNDLIYKIENFPLPIITIIKNQASGFLFEIVLASHLCIASESAKFEIADREKLKKQIGSKNAEKLNSIENKFDAKTALDLGIVNKITTVENPEKEALETVKKISELAPIAISYCLKAVNQGLEMDLKDGLNLETELFSRIFATVDMKEGTSAFLEKREPVFNGQ
ncbi:MAG: enoyl-CoA hydratase-related protein [Aridibacter sp.]